MADGLRIKISETKYRETINKLGDKIAELQDCLEQLQTQKGKLKGAYGGPAAEKAYEAIEANETKVKESIEKVTKQKDKIQQYLDSMSQVNTKIEKDYDDALARAQKDFD